MDIEAMLDLVNDRITVKDDNQKMTGEQFILRVESSGRISAMSERARRSLGPEALGMPCDKAVRGLAKTGKAHCRDGCAHELAAGLVDDAEPVDAVVRGQDVHLRCIRVGGEVVVVADSRATPEPTEVLTQRERQVLQAVALGHSTAQIAVDLGITPATVRTHVEHARGRLGARTRAEAVLKATRTGQLELGL